MFSVNKQLTLFILNCWWQVNALYRWIPDFLYTRWMGTPLGFFNVVARLACSNSVNTNCLMMCVHILTHTHSLASLMLDLAPYLSVYDLVSSAAVLSSTTS